MTTEKVENKISTSLPTPEGVGTPTVSVGAAPEVRQVRAPSGGDTRPTSARQNRSGGEQSFGRGGRRPNRRAPRRDARVKPEFDQKIVSLRRVTRVMAGGRRFNFSVALVAGNRKGMVGVGQGKAADTPLAIEKAFRDAKKNMITINTTKEMSIPHDIEAKYAASVVKLMPAPGKGILAGSSVRTVLELAGLKNVGGKLLSRSKNSANNAYVTIKALQKLDSTKIRHESPRTGSNDTNKPIRSNS